MGIKRHKNLNSLFKSTVPRLLRRWGAETESHSVVQGGLANPGWDWTHGDIPAWASWVLGLQACTTIARTQHQDFAMNRRWVCVTSGRLMTLQVLAFTCSNTLYFISSCKLGSKVMDSFKAQSQSQAFAIQKPIDHLLYSIDKICKEIARHIELLSLIKLRTNIVKETFNFIFKDKNIYTKELTVSANVPAKNKLRPRDPLCWCSDVYVFCHSCSLSLSHIIMH